MKRRAVVLIAALALVGAACGDDDDSGVAEGGTQTTDASGATGDTGTGTAGDTEDTTDGDDDGSGDGGGEFCDMARDVEEGEDLLDEVDFTDPDSLRDAYRTMIDRMQDASDSAPDEIRDDIEIVVNRAEEVFQALEDADFNFVDVDQSVLEDPEAEEATARIDEYLESECGIDTGDDVVTDDTVTGDTSDDTTGGGDAGDGGDVEGTIREQLVTQFTAMGMTEDQANCLIDKIDFTAAQDADPTEFLELFDECDIDLTELQPGS